MIHLLVVVGARFCINPVTQTKLWEKFMFLRCCFVNAEGIMSFL